MPCILLTLALFCKVVRLLSFFWGGGGGEEEDFLVLVLVFLYCFFIDFCLFSFVFFVWGGGGGIL